MPAHPRATFPSIALSISINRAVEAVVGFAGLAVYIVLIGGVKQWGRLTAAGLPADQAIDALEPNQFFGDGATALLFPVACVLVLLYFARLVQLRPRSDPEKKATPRSAVPLRIAGLITVTLGFIGALFIAATLTLALLVLVGLDEEFLDGDRLVFTCFAVVAVLLGLVLFRAGQMLLRWFERRESTEFGGG